MSPEKKTFSYDSAQSTGTWSAFLKSITSFKGDISTLTAPPFLLSSTSLIEYSAHWAEHPEVFIAPSKEPNPEKRALLVLKWFLTTLRQQYFSRSEKLGSEKKPLNPFLGELFIGSWLPGSNDVGETTLISEQVSHHPPSTAYAIRNEEHGVELQGYNAQKVSFFANVRIKQFGHALYKVAPPGSSEKETYMITLPALRVHSLFYGSPFVELENSAKIASSNGFIAEIDFLSKGWFSGKKDFFTATLYKESGGKEDPIYNVHGQWSGNFLIRKNMEEVDHWDATENTTTPLTLAPIEQQDLYESRRAWRDVSNSIRKNDMGAVSRYKARIEQAQRELRRVEKAEGREWKRRFFNRIGPEDDDATVQELASLLGFAPNLNCDKTGGIWRFDAHRAAGAQPPYYEIDGERFGLTD
ncbi:hypothetical protein N7448_005396 [Penicillium atrosanguineum]|uniref:Oxysterol-binding protein n=1 Tax=Penicillium atrosanguineum TaxID=1132637 RepID=A0A9W9H3C2_9EURO|nr:Transcriptional activator of proteases prtT [Penicillium atrosanguineum]KAJ5126086.1 hypothetical protein N7526_008263 [Penicillium atrosanguineum]KAJ5136842.1 hypothetical protein N7448_005396 [Penicillium atrosanguineum]KAJ5293173.1 Transcriptional activator of proteases prtT [Penicillium atrosanguineum]KAJ5302790.1 hypothetical protein N7476_009589 [Penicillium atrosanguineum]